MSRWVLSINSEHDDPRVLGPYSQATAQRLADQFNASNDARSDEDRLGDFLYASAYPLERLTITQLRAEYGLRRLTAAVGD